METEAAKLLESEHIPKKAVQFIYSLDMRYVKQYHELNVRITREELERGDVMAMADKFHPEHNRLFGYSLEEQGTPIQLINLRLLSIGKTVKPQFLEEAYAGGDPSGAFKRKRKVYLPRRRVFEEIPVYDGHKLEFGNRIEGPAIIEQVNTTTFVTPEFNVLCDRYGSYTMYMKSREEGITKKIGIGT
jgi:N-methylhydantoinase A